MLRYFLTAILLILFSPFIHAQLSIEHGPLWSKASIVNPHHYQSNQHWGSGIQTSFWLGFDHGKPTRLRIGALWGHRRTYFTRYYPEYTIEPLSSEVSRRENFFTLVALLEQRLIRFNPFERTVSGALGAEFPGTSSYQAQVQPGGAMPGGSQGGSLFPTIKATVQFRTGVLYHPTPRLSVALEAMYDTHVSLIFIRIGAKYVPQTLGLNLKANYYIGQLKIPEVK